MVGWPHRLDGHEFEQALGVGDRQGSLECCSPYFITERASRAYIRLSIARTLCFAPILETKTPVLLQLTSGEGWSSFSGGQSDFAILSE